MLGNRLRAGTRHRQTRRVAQGLVEALGLSGEAVASRMAEIEGSAHLQALLALGVVRRDRRPGRIPQAAYAAYWDAWAARFVRQHDLDRRHPGWIDAFATALPGRDAARLARRYDLPEGDARRLISYFRQEVSTPSPHDASPPVDEAVASQYGPPSDVTERIAAFVQAYDVSVGAFRDMLMGADLDVSSVATRLGCPPQEVVHIRELLQSVQVADVRDNQTVRQAAAGLDRHDVIAEIDYGTGAVAFTGSAAVGSSYSVDLGLARSLGIVDAADDLGRTVASLQWLAERSSILKRSVLAIVAFQERYLRSGADIDLAPTSQADIARVLDVSRSTVSRAVSGRMVRLPWGRVVPLRHLLRDVGECVRCIATEFPDLSVARIADELETRYGVERSPRTIRHHLSGRR